MKLITAEQGKRNRTQTLKDKIRPATMNKNCLETNIVIAVFVLLNEFVKDIINFFCMQAKKIIIQRLRYGTKNKAGDA